MSARVRVGATSGCVPPRLWTRQAVWLSTGLLPAGEVRVRYRQELLAEMNRQPITCRMNLHHVWHREHTEDGGRYRRCVRCGKDDPGSPFNPNTLIAM